VPSGWLGSAVLAALAGVASMLSLASAATPPNRVAIRGERIAGHTYVEWEVAAWQWELAHLTIPRSVPDPALCVTADQPQAVWFLGASFDRRPSVIGACAIPAGRFILVPSPSLDCSTVQPRPFRAHTDAGLRRCARARWHAFAARHTVILDGVTLKPPGYVLATPGFVFAMPAADNYLSVPGATAGRAATYGYADMLRPLSPGLHTLVRISRYARSAPTRTTWLLAVG
jgi:hypothetical protein